MNIKVEFNDVGPKRRGKRKRSKSNVPLWTMTTVMIVTTRKKSHHIEMNIKIETENS